MSGLRAVKTGVDIEALLHPSALRHVLQLALDMGWLPLVLPPEMTGLMEIFPSGRHRRPMFGACTWPARAAGNRPWPTARPCASRW